MPGQTLILRGDVQRQLAKQLIDKAPVDAVVNIREAKRSLDQNAKMWAMLSDISRAKPGGLCYTSSDWKCVFMNACGHEVQFLQGVDGKPFPAGLKTSNLTVAEMRELIEYLYWFGAENGINWSEEVTAA